MDCLAEVENGLPREMTQKLSLAVWDDKDPLELKAQPSSLVSLLANIFAIIKRCRVNYNNAFFPLLCAFHHVHAKKCINNHNFLVLKL